MDITPLIGEDQQIIQGYGAATFRINGLKYDTPLIVMPDAVQVWPAPPKLQDLTENDFQSLIDRSGELDVVLLGTGKNHAFPEPSLKTALRRRGLILDVMDTGAACRTYNVLMAEGRRVAAALLLY